MNKSAKATQNLLHRQRFYSEKDWAISRAIILGLARVNAYDVVKGLLSVSFSYGGQIHVPPEGLSPDACRSVRARLLVRFGALAS
jgi:hypothetical protein